MDLWIFSKIFHQTISIELEGDQSFTEWLWYIHNAIFYENEPGSTKIKSEWSIDDPNFEINITGFKDLEKKDLDVRARKLKD